MFDIFIEKYSAQGLGAWIENERLAKHTTMRVGGPARLLVVPKDKQAFIETIKLARTLNILFKIFGKGSNLLVSDAPYDGIIIKTEKALAHYTIESTTIKVEEGVSDVKLARLLAKSGLTGLEFLSGVPGTIGGAIFMNAGAYNREMKDVLKRVEVLDEHNEIKWLSVDELALAYRTSIFQKCPDWHILSCELQLANEDADEIIELMDERKARRKVSQPLELPSSGSTFRNPAGQKAWELIENVGLRGFQSGGAQVSEKHANFVVNVDNATAQDVVDVIDTVKKQVKEKHDIDMHPEVEFFNW